MTAIRFSHVDFAYDSPSNSVFNDLNLLLDSSWRTGLIGRNGMGKSTLLRLLSGELTPTSGDITLREQPVYFPASVNRNQVTRHVVTDACGPFRQWEAAMATLLETDDVDSLSRYSDIQERYQAAGGYNLAARIEAEFADLGLPAGTLDRDFSTLSGGEQTRALVAALFAVDNKFALIDEPTNHLDMAGRRRLADYLQSKSGFVLVSHDRDFLDGAVDHIVAINKADIEVIKGSYSAWRQQFLASEQHEERTRANIERETKALKRAALERREGSQSREREKYKSAFPRGKAPKTIDRGHVGHMAAKQMKRALAVERRMDKRLEDKQGLLANQEKQRQLIINTASSHHRLLTVNDLTFGYGTATLFSHLNLTVDRGERIAITGANGTGKSTLFELLAGELTATTGTISRPAHIRFSRAYQQPVWTHGLLRDHLTDDALDETRFRQVLGSFGVRGDIFERPLETFSMGQQKKVDLARSMIQAADFLMWDEPLNYVDVFSREQIEAAILASAPTMLFIEHDRQFVDRVATGVIELG